MSVFSVSAAYIKVYLLENGICVAKKKTKSVRKSLDPLYNQVLVFSESPQGKVVQVRHFTSRCGTAQMQTWSFRPFSLCIQTLLFSFWTCHFLTMSASSVYHLLAAVACSHILRSWAPCVKRQTVKFIKGILYY